ncbi:MAG TPA: DUF6062 family protein [Candidatus Deferrimicrobiaceae bacterium]|nr:DUF6062 family protein [Candidatus Deferrimicrobiaceae bacterium]
MTSPGHPLRDKFIGFFRLVDACERPGCPVCRCLELDARQYLEGLLHEAVTDPDTRTRLYGSWGFCNWHGWLLRETPVPAFGASIIYEDLLRLALERLEQTSPRRVLGPRGPFGWLCRLFGRRRAPERVEWYRQRAVCPGCRQTADSEERYLRAALQFVDDDQFASAYGRSQGFCVPHVIRALELGAGGHQAETLIARTLPKLVELRRDLTGFVSKHDHRRRQPFSEAEGTAYLRAFETLVGAPGVFGNEAHCAERSDEATRSTDRR